MTLPAHVGRGRRSGVVLVSLLLGTFVTGSAELLTVGRLPLISSGLGVSVAAAGALFSAYAVGLAIGGPLLTAATIRLDRRPVLVGSMALFAMLVVAPAALPHFGWFVAARLGRAHCRSCSWPRRSRRPRRSSRKSSSAGPTAAIITGMIIALGPLALAVSTRRLQPPTKTELADLTHPSRVEAGPAA